MDSMYHESLTIPAASPDVGAEPTSAGAWPVK